MGWRLEDPSMHEAIKSMSERIWASFIDENYNEIRHVAERCLKNRDICDEIVKLNKMRFTTPLDIILYMKRRVSRQSSFKALRIDGILAGQWWVEKLEQLWQEAKLVDERIIRRDDLAKQTVIMKWYVKAICDIIETNDVAPLPSIQ